MKNNTQTKKRRLALFSLLTLSSIYFLILVGGIVRTTGSGMGCPDWPKCFGSWVPPTEISELPADYKQIYSAKRANKNERLIGYLEALGMNEIANKIRNDESILVEADFNPTKTWIEYINRLIGVLIGLFVIVTVYLALRLYAHQPSYTYWAILSLLLVIFQGWLGSLVVSTNLIPFMVTTHMLLALVIVFVLTLIVVKTNPQLHIEIPNRNRVNFVLMAGMVAMLIQIILGTQVREQIDMLKVISIDRNEWIDELGNIFLVHRSFSWIVLGTGAMLLFFFYKIEALNKTVIGIAAVILLSLITGIVMAYAGVPKFAQPIHLLLGAMGVGLQFLLFLQLNLRPNREE